jgi:hypothetical protein
MKTKSILSIILLFCSLTIFAQHPLIGTWELVSLKGTDADGKPYNWNTANLRITKIITPTHYMLMQHIVRNDSVIFNNAHAGPIQFADNKYSHTQTVSSDAATIGTKSDYTWKVKSNQLIQSGAITGADGKKTVIDELVYKRVDIPAANSKNPVIGTWNQLSSEYTLFDGTKDSHTSPAVTRFDIFTPSHWARIGHRDGKFESAAISSYILQSGKLEPTVIVASSPIYAANKYEISYRVDGSKLYVNGRATNAEGKQFTWNDVFQKTSDK